MNFLVTPHMRSTLVSLYFTTTQKCPFTESQKRSNIKAVHRQLGLEVEDTKMQVSSQQIS